MRFIEVYEHFWSAEDTDYVAAYIHYWVKAIFHIEVSDNKVVLFFPSKFTDPPPETYPWIPKEFVGPRLRTAVLE